MLRDIKRGAQGHFADWSDGMLSVALLAGAVVIIVIALRPGHHLVKALALAYIVLP